MSISTTYTAPSIANPALQVLRSNNVESNNVWAVILAGGDGLPKRQRIPSYLRGQRPKQFCRTADSEFLINQTREKVALAIPLERTMIAVTENHLHYAADVMGNVPRENLIVEPQDDGTVFAILYSLFRLRKRNPSATVVFFPADLNVPDADGFVRTLHDAVEAVRRQPRLILLGLEPTRPDRGREWIEPDRSATIHGDLRVSKVLQLHDTVSHDDARDLIRRGGLWNSSVMVGTIWSFLRKIRRIRPDLYASFKAVAPKIDTPGEAMAIRRIYYENYTETDLLRDVLEHTVEKLAVIPAASVKVKGVGRESPIAARSRHRAVTFEHAIAAAAGRA